jgi:hypothetical protein
MKVRTLSRFLWRAGLSFVLLLIGVWGALALGYQAKGAAGQVLLLSWCLLGGMLQILLWRGRIAFALVGCALPFAGLLVWWVSLEPSNQRIWADDVAQMSWGQVDGNQLTVHNVRNFNWRSEQDYDVAWETRRYELNQLSSLDLSTSYWGMPEIAHVLVSFGFADGRFLTFTVEVRKEKGEAYSEIGGFFKEFELSIVATDERDALRVRTNVRGEDVYLYRIDMPPEAMQALLLSYVEQANALVEQPRFYNTITANCTTIVFDMLQQIVGGLQDGYTLEELHERGRITDRAQAAHDAPDFSWRIRRDVLGWSQ